MGVSGGRWPVPEAGSDGARPLTMTFTEPQSRSGTPRGNGKGKGRMERSRLFVVLSVFRRESYLVPFESVQHGFWP